ncbi:MAG: hypothetical protein EOL87_13800 [Spartobacteria bacterium]|nr:hypothetical protein [Spartobacteria bacterium]
MKESLTVSEKRLYGESIIEMLRGNTAPAKPDGIMLGEQDRPADYPYLAITRFAIYSLSRSQRDILGKQGGDLSELGISFWLFLTDSDGAKAKEVLNADVPYAMLCKKFGGFLKSSPRSPFYYNPMAKIKERLDDLLMENPEFYVRNGRWHLASAERDTPICSGLNSDKVIEHITATLGTVTPVMWNFTDEAMRDPLISPETAFRYARAVIELIGPTGSWGIAGVIYHVMEPKPWRSPFDVNLDALVGVEAEGHLQQPELPHDADGLPVEDAAIIAETMWNSMNDVLRVILATRHFTQPAWSCRAVGEWCVAHPEKLRDGKCITQKTVEYYDSVTKAQREAGQHQSAVLRDLRTLLESFPEEQMQDILHELSTVARKFIEAPAS